MAKFRRTMEAERAERDEKQKEEAKAEQAARSASVEAECMAYGHGRGNHYSAFSGWGNYCGD